MEGEAVVSRSPGACDCDARSPPPSPRHWGPTTPAKIPSGLRQVLFLAFSWVRGAGGRAGGGSRRAKGGWPAPPPLSFLRRGTGRHHPRSCLARHPAPPTLGQPSRRRWAWLVLLGRRASGLDWLQTAGGGGACLLCFHAPTSPLMRLVPLGRRNPLSRSTPSRHVPAPARAPLSPSPACPRTRRRPCVLPSRLASHPHALVSAPPALPPSFTAARPAPLPPPVG